MKKLILSSLQSLQIRCSLLKTVCGLTLAFFAATAVQAITRTWDGEAGTLAWSSATNWSGDTVPVAGDVAIIDGPYNVVTPGWLPNPITLYLTNSASFGGAVTRIQGSSVVNIASNCTLNNYWALYQATMNFQNGAKWTAGDVEVSGPVAFNFKLGPAGFTTLTPGWLRPNAMFSNQTWTVDLADYTGPSPADFILMDCAGNDGGWITSLNFWNNATRNVINKGTNVGSTVVFDAAATAFILKVRVAPVTFPYADKEWTGRGGNLLWNNATNWTPVSVPVAGNTVEIAGPVTVEYVNSLPVCTISLKNGAGLKASANALRLDGATINVASNSVLSGAWWDLNAGTLNFVNGAGATMTDWEQKGINRFNFKLGPAGFITLLPGRLWGTSPITSTISNATYIADMANYIGNTGIITLVDFSADNYGMTPELFQNAKLSVTNTDGYVGNLQWNNTAKSIELNVTVLPVYYWDNDGTTAGTVQRPAPGRLRRQAMAHRAGAKTTPAARFPRVWRPLGAPP